MTKEERRRREYYLARRRMRKRRRRIQIISRVLFVVILAVMAVTAVTRVAETLGGQKKETSAKPEKLKKKTTEEFKQKVIEEEPEFSVELLTPNEYSRPQSALEKVEGIVIHYTANPGTSAAQNRSYFESLKDTQETKASSHFIVGIEGEIIQCIPSSEISYASNDRNYNTLSIECCHMEEDGKFTEETYRSLVELTAWLCGKFNLPVESVIRHYDVTGKKCPLYFVEHEEEWEQFQRDVQSYLEQHGV